MPFSWNSASQEFFFMSALVLIESRMWCKECLEKGDSLLWNSIIRFFVLCLKKVDIHKTQQRDIIIYKWKIYNRNFTFSYNAVEVICRYLGIVLCSDLSLASHVYFLPISVRLVFITVASFHEHLIIILTALCSIICRKICIQYT